MGKPPLTLKVEGQRYRRAAMLYGPSGQLSGIYRPVKIVYYSTAEWIGTPSKQDIEFFLWCMFGTVAERASAKNRHQTEQMSGPFITYGKSKGQRGSDFGARIYAAVRLLEMLGDSNLNACREIAKHPCVEPRLCTTNRGRQRQTLREPDFLDKAQTVRGLYNSQRARHRWPEKLPRTDAELEFFWRYFLDIRKWAFELMHRLNYEAKQKHISQADHLARLVENHVGWSEAAVLVLREAVRIYGRASQLGQNYNSASTDSCISSRAESSSSSPRKRS